jgi:hypothetical protein
LLILLTDRRQKIGFAALRYSSVKAKVKAKVKVL